GHLVAGRYRLLALIAGGGMGTVWRARDEVLGRQVAVKQIVPPPGADEDLVHQLRQRALREGRIAARLSHPHAISVYDVAIDGGEPWLVMEYLPSRSLAQVLFDDGSLPPDPVAQIGAQVADALAATHAAGIVHRDVKPANVLVGQGGDVEGLVKITDFGISHAIGDVTLTQTGLITGTPAFLAPEAAQGTEMSEASDVFSLGATLYTCLEGQPPFGMDDNALRLLHRVAGGSVRPPIRAGALTASLMAMLTDDPATRPTMAQVRDRLARLAVGRDGDPTTVLLARTDLRLAGAPPAPAPVEQAAPLKEPAAAEEAVDPASAPAPPPAAGDPRRGPVPADAPRSRRRWPPLVAGLVLLLAIGSGVGSLVASSGGDDGTSADRPASSSAPASTDGEQSTAPPPTAPPPTAPPPTSAAAQSSEPTTTAATTSPTSQVPPASTDPATEVEQLLDEYYRLVPGNPRTAYSLTGPSLRSRVSYQSYAGFWSTWSEVSLLDVRDVSVDGGRITAITDVEFTRPGETQDETHAVTFVRGEDGKLLVDLDVLA
ncbi:MAG TPA: serine/threonine-protein kinase, partial [Acidimicrobiia bacterium]|nr:serine/threonine-protein kinase [Acidimicrobiia bacterium]